MEGSESSSPAKGTAQPVSKRQMKRQAREAKLKAAEQSESATTDASAAVGAES